MQTYLGMGKSRAADQRGIVLPTVVLSLAIMGLLAVVALRTADDERRSERALRESGAVLYADEAGLRSTIGAWPTTALKALKPGDSLSLGWQLLPNRASHRVVIHRVDQGGLQQYAVVAQAKGAGPLGGRSTVVQMVSGVSVFRWGIFTETGITLTFLADLANRHKVTQVNPGKTNRTDGAFQLFKDGKVGMVIGFSPLARQLDAEGKVKYGVAEMPTRLAKSVTLGVEDYLMAFKKKDNREAVKKFLDLYYQPDNITRWITAEGFLPVTKSGLERMRADARLKPYLDALPNARLAPTTDPAWDRVKLDVQQNIGLAVQPGGNPKQVLDQLQRNAVAAAAR